MSGCLIRVHKNKDLFNSLIKDLLEVFSFPLFFLFHLFSSNLHWMWFLLILFFLLWTLLSFYHQPEFNKRIYRYNKFIPCVVLWHDSSMKTEKLVIDFMAYRKKRSDFVVVFQCCSENMNWLPVPVPLCRRVRGSNHGPQTTLRQPSAWFCC